MIPELTAMFGQIRGGTVGPPIVAPPSEGADGFATLLPPLLGEGGAEVAPPDLPDEVHVDPMAMLVPVPGPPPLPLTAAAPAPDPPPLADPTLPEPAMVEAPSIVLPAADPAALPLPVGAPLPATAPPAAPPPAAPALPVPVPLPIAALVFPMPDGPVELVLQPEELGRLRFEIHHKGDAVFVTLAVERPDTLDLLRRHADQLVAEFRQAGFDGATLSFGQWGRNSGGSAQRSAQDFTTFTLTDTSAPPSQAVGASGLDLRL